VLPMAAAAPLSWLHPSQYRQLPHPDWCDAVSGPVEDARYRTRRQWFRTAAALAPPHPEPGQVAWNDH
jgi:hypothetical protein